MCIPSPQVSAAPANQVPSMQDANNIDLGGSNAPRGAANLGRLMLRLQGNPTGVAAPAAAPTAPSVAPSTGPAPVAGLGPAPAGNSIVNAGLRMGPGRGAQA